jgi:hypothetical protein
MRQYGGMKYLWDHGGVLIPAFGTYASRAAPNMIRGGIGTWLGYQGYNNVVKPLYQSVNSANVQQQTND